MLSSAIETILIRLRRSKRPAQPSYPVAAYRTFLGQLDAGLASSVTFRSKNLRLTNDLMQLAADVSRCIGKKKGISRRLLLFELLDRDADVITYDDLCSVIHSAISSEKASRLWCIAIAVTNISAFKESLLLSQRLQPFCNKRSTGLIVFGCSEQTAIEVLVGGKLPGTVSLTPLQPRPSGQVIAVQDAKRSPEEIETEFRILFGHFETVLGGTKYHIPAIASARRLANDRVFVQQFKNQIAQNLGNVRYQVLPIGIPQGGIDDLCVSVVDGDINRLLAADYTNLEHDAQVVLVSDFVMRAHPFEQICTELRSRGSKQLMIAGIGKYADAPQIRDVHMSAFIHTNYTVAQPGDSCGFCIQGVPAIPGEGYDALAHQVRDFDPFTFWQLVRQSPDHYRAGHWKSDRTSNHFQFRIMVGPILQRHCHALSLRLRNVLESRSILPSWINKIMCTEGEESRTLALGLASVVGLSPQDVIAIPRKYFTSIVGADVGDEVLPYLAEKYGKSTLRHQNVVLVDQAAHHFKTLSALRTICEYLDSTILAFAVVVDRTDATFSLGEFLHDSHYVSLYSWSSPPRLPHECPCAEACA